MTYVYNTETWMTSTEGEGVPPRRLNNTKPTWYVEVSEWVPLDYCTVFTSLGALKNITLIK